MNKKKDIQVIAFDADDTLWNNETYFRQTEDAFYELMAPYAAAATTEAALFNIEMTNLPLYGYGIKGFMLCMMETAVQLTAGRLDAELTTRILQLGKQMMEEPVELIDGVETVLQALQPHYRLVVATKGDLVDQERKLKKSGLLPYFHHIEIMSEKDEHNYRKLVKHLDISTARFLMAGNSLKSDILPVLQLGGHAAHIPYHITWAHEHVADTVAHERFYALASIHELIDLL